MRVLVVGGGGREHALVHSFAQSPLADRIFCAPGNAGTAAEADNVPIAADDLPRAARLRQPRGGRPHRHRTRGAAGGRPHRPVRGARPRRVRAQQGGGAARGQQGLRQGDHGRRRRGHRRLPPPRAPRVGARATSRAATTTRWSSRPTAWPPARASLICKDVDEAREAVARLLRGARVRRRPATCSSPRSTSPAPRSRCWCSATARRRCRSRRRRTTSASSPATRGPTPAAWAATARCRGSSSRPSTPRWSTSWSPSSRRCASAASPTAACCTPA